MDRTIITTAARLDSKTEMAAFLSPIPNGDQLAKVLEGGKPVSTRAYEDEAQIARFVESDGTTVVCFAVENLTIDQAEMIEAEWEGMCALDESLFRTAVHQALDDPFRRRSQAP
jgi:hypothetical protein